MTQRELQLRVTAIMAVTGEMADICFSLMITANGASECRTCFVRIPLRQMIQSEKNVGHPSKAWRKGGKETLQSCPHTFPEKVSREIRSQWCVAAPRELSRYFPRMKVDHPRQPESMVPADAPHDDRPGHDSEICAA
jgi:hypothetical protein